MKGQELKLKVSDWVADFLARRELRHVFGIVGAGNVHLFDSLNRRGATQIVSVHHEQTATMAVQTYFRLTGRTGVAIVTTGAGSTNAITGVLSAWMDSMATVILSGNENSRFTRPENRLRVWGVQGYESAGAVAGMTKYSARVLDPRRIAYELEKAFHIAESGRPGPCWIDIPMDVQASLVEEADLVHFDPLNEPLSGLPSRGAPTVEAGRALEMLRAAKRPVFWLGNGIRLAGAAGRLEGLLETARIPTLVSWTGIDMVDSSHPLVYGRAGVYGQRCANFVLQNADLVVAIGTRLALPQIGYVLDEFARAARLVVVDVDQEELDKLGTRIDLPVHADAGRFLDAFGLLLERTPVTAPADWIARCDGYRARYPWVGPEHTDEDGYINTYRFMERLVGQFKPDQIVVTDVGPGLLSGHQVLKIAKGQRLMTSLGLGEMGFGLPAAIGASFARGKGEVMCLAGDGGIMINLQELQTMVHHRLPIKLLIFNNDGYLMIKHTQNALFKGRQTAVDHTNGVSCPDFVKLASAMGMPSYAIRNWQDFDDVMPKVQQIEGPVVCEVFMHPLQPYVPKLSVVSRADGSLESPPLEDLSPILPRSELSEDMLIGAHPKSLSL